MPRIVFIEPKSPSLHIFSQFTLPRLGTILLGTQMKQRGWEVEVNVEEMGPLDYESIKNADLVGISTITSTAPRAFAIADRIRALGVPVIMGGPHVTFLPEEALQHADFVIRGEGEKALQLFIDQFEGAQNYASVPNLSFWFYGEVVHNPMLNHVENLDALPFPDFTLIKQRFSRIAGRTIIPIQTSRGCPFDCDFCSVTGMFGKKYRFRSTESILAELRQYDQPDHFIFFYDDNFTANRPRVKALLQAMIDEKFKFQWSTQVRADIAEDLELVQLMKKAGCHTLFIGFESVNPASLKAMKKGQTVDDIINASKVLRRHHIHIHGMFVYGFEDDDWSTIKATVRFAKKARLTSTQFLILTPLPGSACFRKMTGEKRIRFHDWKLYDAHHVVFQPLRLSLLDLQRAQIFSHRKFYSLLGSIRKLLTFKLVDFGLAKYARRINHQWLQKNKTFLRVIELLTPKKDAHIEISYQERVFLEEEGASARG